MARGLAIPVRVSGGRAVLSSGAEQVGKLALLSMSDRDNGNPFNGDVGVEAPVFGLDDVATRTLLRRDIEQHFRRLQAADRAKLVELQFEAGNGELTAHVRYVDLETDDEHEVTRRVART